MSRHRDASFFDNPSRRTRRTSVVQHLIFGALLCSLLCLSCKETPPEPPPPKTLSLRVEDASCTEAWLKVTTTETPATVRLLRDNQRVSVLGLRTSDSLLIDEGLLPRRTYTYQLQKLLPDSSVAETSASVTVTTMDTTSHNFTWQMDTLGVTSSVLYDVAIINDTLAYAVGEMYLRDSTGQVDPTPYGLAVWNGRAWTLKRILVRSQQGSIHSRVFQGVFAFSATDVWLGDGNAFHWDGRSEFATAYWISGYPGNPTPVLGPNQGVTKFWGASSSNLYGVGVNGGIAHYNGTSWQRVESGTSVDLRDVYGTAEAVWASGWSNDQSQSIVLRYRNGTCTKIWQRLGARTEPYGDIVSSVWAQGTSLFVSSNYGGFETIMFNSMLRTKHRFPVTSFPYRIRGSARNDVVVVGDYGKIWHYNGAGVQLSFPGDTDLRLRSAAIRNNFVLATGYRYDPIESKAIVVLGRR